MSDNTDPFTNGPNQAKFGDPDVSSSDSPDDWAGWDWHQLEAAILGGSGMTTQVETQTAAGIADPSSLQNAADVFYNVQQTLNAVADDLVHQASLLAGQDDSPWQGQAANSFLAMIKSFANDIYANVSALQDAAGTSVPDELINNANKLQWAQNEVSLIDSYYANLAAQAGANTVDGAVQVHEVSWIPGEMTKYMMQVMGALVDNYKSNGYNTAVAPQAVNPNASNGSNNGGDANGPNYGAPNYPNPNYPQINIPNPNIPNFQYPNPNIPNYGNLGGDPNLGSGGPNLTGGPNAGLGGDPNAGLNGGPNAGLDGGPNLSGGPNAVGDSPVSGSPDLSAAPNAVGDEPVGSSEPGLSDSPNLKSDLANGSPDYSALNPAMDNALNPSSAATSPNLTSSDPAGLNENAGLPGTEDLATPSGASSPLDDGSGVPDEGGMPYMPGAGSGMGSSPLGSEPSDASGLLGKTTPFSSDSPVTGDEVGSPSGAAPGVGVGGEPLAVGGESPGESPAVDDGMPYMPGMGSGAGPQAFGGEPSDASGLLGRESEPWSEAELPAGDEVGSADGAEAANPAEEEMPFMPGMGGGAQAAASSTDEHSDASGLLAEGDEFWTEGDEEYSPEVGLDNAAVVVGAAQAAWIGAGAAVAEPGPGEDKAEAAGYEAAGYEEFFEPGDGEGEFAEFAEPDGDGDEEHGQDAGAERVPVVGTDGSDEDLSGWDLAGAAADAALFTLGAWATRRRGRDDEDETSARIVSSEQEAWLGEDIALPDYDEDADALPGAATWRPNRESGGLTESARISNGMLRSAPPPKNYDPVAAAAAAAEAHEAERTAVQQAEVDEKWQRSTADLLTQDRDMWGGAREDWDAL